eukprot:scaffold24159_cov68-Phaeocystis_antarctica.AAC.9
MDMGVAWHAPSSDSNVPLVMRLVARLIGWLPLGSECQLLAVVVQQRDARVHLALAELPRLADRCAGAIPQEAVHLGDVGLQPRGHRVAAFNTQGRSLRSIGLQIPLGATHLGLAARERADDARLTTGQRAHTAE